MTNTLFIAVQIGFKSSESILEVNYTPVLSHKTADVTIEFEDDGASVSEGSTVDVCLILIGNIEVNVPVNLTFEEETASMCNTLQVCIK